MKKYNRRNCEALVRKVHTSHSEETIQLLGKFAFEYQVIICRKSSIKTYIYKDRSSAVKEFNRLTKIYK